MNKLNIFLLIVCVFALLTISFAIAANENAPNKSIDKDKNKTEKENIKENKTTENKTKLGTYGQCVVAGVVVRTACYNAAKDKQDSCKQVAANSTDKATKKADTKKCQNTYKSEMKQCKADFQLAKTECQKTMKPKFFERMQHVFD